MGRWELERWMGFRGQWRYPKIVKNGKNGKFQIFFGGKVMEGSWVIESIANFEKILPKMHTLFLENLTKIAVK